MAKQNGAGVSARDSPSRNLLSSANDKNTQELRIYKIIYRAFFGLFGAGAETLENKGFKLVGAEGFEPPTPCSQSRCATRLRHAPTLRVLGVV